MTRRSFIKDNTEDARRQMADDVAKLAAAVSRLAAYEGYETTRQQAAAIRDRWAATDGENT